VDTELDGATMDDMDEDDAGEGGAQKRFDTLRLSEILTPDINLAEYLAEDKVAQIGRDVIRDVEIDEDSRKEWLERYKTWMDMAMQVRSVKNYPWPKAANVKYPLLTTAAIQFQARAYPVIVDGGQLVKGKVLGPDPDGIKRDRADRIAGHMSYQLLYKMPGWEEDTDRLLLQLPIIGCVFRKTYYDAVGRKNISETISAEDFIINYHAKSIAEAPRATHRLRYYPHEIRERVLSGMWLDIRHDHDEEGGHDDDDALRIVYEQHRKIDLDGDGYPEPYIVTTNHAGQVARIAPAFGPDDVTVTTASGMMRMLDALQSGVDPEDIIRIEPREYFTKYSFITAPDGSFYDIGFGWLLEDIGEAVNGTINQMLDAGALQNAGGGFISSAVNVRGGEMRFRLGEWKRIEVGGPIGQSIFPFPASGPAPVLFNLLQLLLSGAKEITSVQDILTGGQQPSNQPATTTLAQVEQAQKVMTAIFKRVHRAFGEELRKLRRLNRDYLDDEEYFQLNDEQQAQVGRMDYADRDLDVMPVSDPTAASDQQRMARAQGLLMFNGDPLVNQVEIRKRVLTAMGQQDVGALLKVPPPPPNPMAMMEMVKEARAKSETDAKVRKSDADSAQVLMSASQIARDMGLMDDAAHLAALATQIGQDAGEPNDQGGIPGMAGPPADQGGADLFQGPSGGPDGAMGGGLPMPPGDAGPGPAIGPDSGPALG